MTPAQLRGKPVINQYSNKRDIMFISHTHNFAFFRTIKTASTSTQSFLIHNFRTPEDSHSALQDEDIPAHNNQYDLQEHTNLKQALAWGAVEPDYQVYATVRCPFDLLISSFFFFDRSVAKKRSPNIKYFRNIFIKKTHQVGKNLTHQHLWLDVGGVQHGTWWAYDNINLELQKLSEKHNVEIKHPMPNHKSITRDGNKNTVDLFYDEYTKDIVREHYARDFEIYYNALETK
jgi:hypothetical protein